VDNFIFLDQRSKDDEGLDVDPLAPSAPVDEDVPF